MTASNRQGQLRLLLLVFASVVAFGLGEAATRLWRWHQYRTEFVAADRGKYKDIYSDEPGTGYVFGHHPNARVVIRRGTEEFTFISNAQGLRELRDYKDLESSVVFLGDSSVEGSTVENDETMDSVFERVTGVTALNFGVASSSTAQSYYWFKGKYDPRYHAKVVILGFNYTDFPETGLLLRFLPERGEWDWADPAVAEAATPARRGLVAFSSWLLHQSAFTTAIYENTFAPPPPVRRPEDVSGRERDLTREILQRHDQLAGAIGARLVVMLLPTRSQVESSGPAGTRFQDLVIPMLSELRIPYVDLQPTLQAAHRERPQARLYWDEGHPYKEGHRIIGEHLAKTVPELLPGVLTATTR